ncbi:hypothetical protein PENSUB_11808 [Penicillium subrubescens]|uniref:Uncharacterized protein n=1 Tax=Penicillium subrubescens TaxID=1316194 RepID=A0A1Q5T2S2_9EURO|nr:hypothetical protein PENSUB_11808 [Penicillium subrubescens]
MGAIWKETTIEWMDELVEWSAEIATRAHREKGGRKRVDIFPLVSSWRPVFGVDSGGHFF